MSLEKEAYILGVIRKAGIPDTNALYAKLVQLLNKMQKNEGDTSTVAAINALTDPMPNLIIKMTDSGTLTLGSLAVVTDDYVRFTGLVWEEAGWITYTSSVVSLIVDTTLVAGDSNKIYLVGADGKTATLPSSAAVGAGVRYTFFNAGTDGAYGFTVSPNAIDKLMGSFNQNGVLVTLTGTNNKDIVNTKATANRGDYLQLISDGVDGWYLESCNGIWLEESQTVKSASFADGVITVDLTQLTNDYSWLQYSQWSTGADMAAGGSYGCYSKANVGHTVQNVIGGKSAIKFLTLAADESINYGSGFEATLELDDVDTHTITVTDHISALNLYFDGSSQVEGVGGGAYSKMNLSRAMWNSTEDFSIETNGYQLETANGSFLDYGLNIYNDGTMKSAIWIHNNPAGGTMVSDIITSSGAKVFTGSAANETAVYAAVGTDGATGSIYLSTAGGLYVQVANAGADADWEKVTTTHT